MAQSLLRIGITLGDAAGIGPEIILKAIATPEIQNICVPLVIGDRLILEHTARSLNLPIPEHILDLHQFTSLPEPGRISAECGKAALAYIEKAVSLCLSREMRAMVTAPIHKEAIHLAGSPYPGHTEMIAMLTNTKEYAMMLVGDGLRVILVTIHMGLANVSKVLTIEKILKTIRLAYRATQELGITMPKIAVAGFNPHAGEQGLFGDEEQTKIAPAIELAKQEQIPVFGPFPPDTIFHRALNNEFDIVVCMYHDQGLIPLKTLAFHTGVNVTIGLPIVRTSVDHGTAYDIAGKGIANPFSMIEAIKLAVQLATNRFKS
ncbi:MAG: 4-hydroxythreonine-4-phosphate dehydrogenase PdxA [bacterium]|nr:4-hydroxythreonine-4-phosphate dehydrogenase PdxA [bacterium]